MSRPHTLVTSLALSSCCAALLVIAACGEAVDRPQDCSANEFFDEADSQCKSCPALTIPGCREGCSILVSSDDRGCPEASCDLTCDACPEGTSFSLETLACEPSCLEGSSLDPFLGVCSTCPGQQDALPDCSDSSCLCSLSSPSTTRAAPAPCAARAPRQSRASRSMTRAFVP